MHQEKYSLTWHTYSDHLRSMMKELLMNEDFSDVTLVTEDKKHIKANINILSTCSPVFKDILKKDRNSSPIIYLRGVQHFEMESIMQFIYLGEATFHEERMDAFLAVAKSLEIKNLFNSLTESTDELVDESSSCDPVKKDENLEEKSVVSDQIQVQAKQGRQRKVVKAFKYCDQCDYQATDKSNLNRHIKSMHGVGVKYDCDQCDYHANRQDTLTIHIESKHKGVKFACNQCDYQAAQRAELNRHIQSQHEGVKYACDLCKYEASWKSQLTRHKVANHQK